MNVTARTSRWLVNALCVVVILFCAAWLLPTAFGLERYVITGGSMSGTFERGAIAFEREVPVDDLAVGDVITFQPPADSGVSDLVTHRIVSISEDEHGQPVFRTKGDANAVADPWRMSLQRSTQPVVAFTVPHAGHVFIALADREVRMALVGGPAGLIALLALAETVRNLRRPDEETVASVVTVPGQRIHRIPAAA
jgi:signal peptidase I